MAVFAPGGVLQQYGPTAQLLSNPANEFVSTFIGAGRGYRWLQLFDAAGLPVHDIVRIVAGSVKDERLGHDWALVINQDNTPMGWIDADGQRRHRAGATLLASLTSVGSVFPCGGNLSQALDAALSSPAAMGVAVDGGGRVIGGVLATDVLAAAEAGRRD